MRTPAVLTLLALMTVALAGCLSDDTAETDSVDLSVDASLQASGRIAIAPDQEPFIGTIEATHGAPAAGPDGAPVQAGAGHQVGELHAHGSGLELTGFNDLTEGLMGPASGFGEVHVKGDLAVVTSLLGSRGATLVDVSDPSDMKVLSHIYNLDDNWDGRISDDGQWLFLGCQGTSVGDCTNIRMDAENPGTNGGTVCGYANCDGGIAVYNITDPTAPSWVGWAPLGSTHNVFAFQHDNGKHYFFSEDMNVGEFDPDTKAITWAKTPVNGNHDVAIQKHPITGDWLLYTGAKHLSVWNVNDPFHPEVVGFVDREQYEGSVPAGWHEQTPMPCLIDGRHITIGGGENALGAPEPIGVFDTTDPTNPVLLGEWALPDAPSLQNQGTYRFSVHNIDGNCDGHVAIGHYHAGVWVFDISTQERQAEPVTLGYYLPHERIADPFWGPITGAPIGAMVTADTPNVWAAQWSEDGQTLFIPDMTTGLYALTPTWEYEEPVVEDTDTTA